jgi:hypothetical protein
MQRLTFTKTSLSSGLTLLVLVGGVLGACGPMTPAMRASLPATVRQAASGDPADPAELPADYLPLKLGQSWRYTNAGKESRGETRTDTVVKLLSRPMQTGGGTVTVAEIERVETGKVRHRFTIERYPNGLARSYDPSLPRTGMPILATVSDKPQEWGYNPNQGQTGYLGIVQWPGTSAVTVGGQAFADCLKVVMSSTGTGFSSFHREITWAPGIGAIRILEGDPKRKHRLYELSGH